MPDGIRVPTTTLTHAATWLALLFCGLCAAEARASATETPGFFPPVEPTEVGVDPAALEVLIDHVETLVDQEEVVGGELLVIQDRRTILRHAFGWRDRETAEPMALDAVYCVRSMTKPLAGTAVQMLVDAGRLELETPVFEILPYFDRAGWREITVDHLLTHTGGLPFSTIGRPLADYPDLEAVVREATERDLEFEPGRGFQYSDAGTDALGAIVARVTGMPVEQFLQQRILDPLEMRDTFTLLAGREPVRSRIPSAYSGGTGHWSRHWEASDPPIFPVFLPSQSLYSTTTDYARFLSLWLDGGRLGERQLLSSDAVRRALSPRSLLEGYPESFGGLAAYYAQQWTVRAAGPEATPVVFGHDGSDGTHTWVWPDRDLMVLFFTQSRGSLAGLRLEPVLQRVLIEGEVEPEAEVRPLLGTERLTGLYWDETNASAYYLVTTHPRGLVVERPGRFLGLFVADPETAGRFVMESQPRMAVEFGGDGPGPAPAMRTDFGGTIEDNPRHQASADLPSVDEVVARVVDAHGIDRLARRGVVRLTGSLTLQSSGMRGRATTHFGMRGQRTEVQMGSVREVTVTDGDRAWYQSSLSGSEELSSTRLAQARLDRFVVSLGDWREHFENLEVLKRLETKDTTLLLVRAATPQAPSVTFFVEESTGRLAVTETVVLVPGLGFVGLQVRHRDYRQVEGAWLPFRATAEFASKQLGRIETRWSKATVEDGSAETLFAEP